MKHKFVIAVATNSSKRFMSFIMSLNQTIDKEELLLLIIDTTINGLNERERNSIRLDYLYCHRPQKKRLPYAAVMQLKIEAIKQFCVEVEFYWNSDDDYVFNPYWYSVIKTLLQHEEINYLSLLKINRTIEDPPELYSSFSLLKACSCMGGAFGARTVEFLPVIEKYFLTYGTNNMFDQKFWELLTKVTGRKDNIYVLNNFSLIQHCNIVSSYIDQKGSKLEHQYGVDFEPIGNPFNLIE